MELSLPESGIQMTQVSLLNSFGPYRRIKTGVNNTVLTTENYTR